MLRLCSPLAPSLISLFLLGACAVAERESASTEAAIVGDAARGGAAAGSKEEAGVLLLVNDRRTGRSDIDALGTPVAFGDALFSARTPAHWFSSIAEVEGLTGASADVFTRLVLAASERGLVEKEAYGDLSLVRMRIPDGLGRPPTSLDITVEAGFDGKSPEDVTEEVVHRITNEIHSSNTRFVSETIVATHKAFTVAMNNALAPTSPSRAFATSRRLEALSFVGTMSSVTPVFIVVVSADGTPTYFARSGGTYVESSMRYPIIMRGSVRLSPAGTRQFYPAWSASALAGPTGVVTEPH